MPIRGPLKEVGPSDRANAGRPRRLTPQDYDADCNLPTDQPDIVIVANSTAVGSRYSVIECPTSALEPRAPRVGQLL